MSKAFTREDDVPEQPVLLQRTIQLPPGVKNYITRQGADRLREELNTLTEVERPRLLNLPTQDTKRELIQLDQRIALLTQSLQSMVVVDPPSEPDDQVRFGSTVRVRDKFAEETVYRLVGIDETDMDRNWISWRSPLARALLNAKAGQRIKFRAPAGEQELEIVSVSYEG